MACAASPLLQTENSPVLHQLARDHAGVAQLAVANGKIEPAGDQVEHFVAEMQMNAQLWMLQAELPQQRHETPPSETVRRGNLEQSGNLPPLARERVARIAEFAHDTRGVRIQQLSRIRHGHAPRAAIDQTHAHAMLQACKAFAHDSERNAEFPGRRGQAAECDDTFEREQPRQMVYFVHSQPFGYTDSPSLSILSVR
jgi:hypothetical protein